MKTWLLYPPFADPTQPYLSLPYLKGYLRSRGLDATVADLNVEAAHALLSRGAMRDCADRLAERLADLNGRAALDGLEQMDYLTLLDARGAARRCRAASRSPVEIFQDVEAFYDYRIYRKARDRAEDALSCHSALHFPFRFHFNQAAHVAAPWGRRLLDDYYRGHKSPLDGFYRSFLENCRLSPGDVVGVSLTFVSQIPEAFYILGLLRGEYPRVFRLLGGSCIQQIQRHAPQSVRHWLLEQADALCLFEGEEALTALLQVLGAAAPGEDKARLLDRLKTIPNLLTRDPGGAEPRSGPIRVTPLDRLPPPDYSDLDLDRYLSPGRTLLFAPTRGCYWNRCSFCDYGMNRSGTHGYRQMEPEAAAEQIQSLARDYGVRNFYLSVDVLAPRFAEAFARQLQRRRQDLCWSTDLRIESYYSPERCEQLFRSGLRAVAFGIESGSDALLKAMHKGIDARQIRSVNANFSRAGIATAWMAFTGHPGETPAQMRETIRLITAQRARVDLFILGRFGLTAGSDIAACPGKYGLDRIDYCRGDDFRLFPLYRLGTQAADSGTEEDLEAIETQIARLSQTYTLDHYPWAGAISTHHSFLYFLRFGQGVFRELKIRPDAIEPAGQAGGPKNLDPRPAFDVRRMRARVQAFMQDFWEEALDAREAKEAPLDEDFFLQALGRMRPARRTTRGRRS